MMIPKLFVNKLATALALLVTTLVIRILGFRYVANYNWIDSAYMTVITINTVGFGEVEPLSPEAKIFTILLILCSVVIVGYFISVIKEYIFSQNS